MQEPSDEPLTSANHDAYTSFLDAWDEGHSDEPVPDFTPTLSELAVLSRHYVDVANDASYCARVYQYRTSDLDHRRQKYAVQRLRTIEEHNGESVSEEAVGTTGEGWEGRFNELEQADGSLTLCAKCGRERAPFEVICGRKGSMDDIVNLSHYSRGVAYV